MSHRRLTVLLVALSLFVPGVAALQAPEPQMAPAPAAAAPVAIPVPTHIEFARCFQPIPGEHRAVMLHPYTCCPIEVCFRLPCEPCARRVRADRNDIEITYGLIRAVKIQFNRDGTYRVKYRMISV
ncbi:MAG TPA: hypothetical protein PKD86_10990 [Gemmatales bacterium]|nr:hypothetical protein [Gemmatales bacterium]